MLVPCLSLSYTLNSPCSSWDAFKEGWQENGLNGVCWRNTYQIWGHAIVGCGFCKAYDSCWGCGSITTCLLSSSPRYSDVEEERKRRAGGKRKELLITCFVWSESPCKYMNSKCRKSNLVAHWYILLFAYLPALVVSSCISGLGTLDTPDFLPFFNSSVHFFFYFTLLCLLLSPVHLFSSSICFFSSPPHPPTSLTLFPSCLPQTSGRISPPAGCMTREQVERRANDKSLSRHLSHCPARGPLWLFPPSFQHLSILSDRIDIQICPGCVPSPLIVKVSPNQRERKKVPHFDSTVGYMKLTYAMVCALQTHFHVTNLRSLIKSAEGG